MRKYFRQAGYFAAILILLPYVVTILLNGRIGHGLGMSQYTAKKMAEEGKSCEEILQYFFTDVSLEEVTDIVIEKNEKGE